MKEKGRKSLFALAFVLIDTCGGLLLFKFFY